MQEFVGKYKLEYFSPTLYPSFGIRYEDNRKQYKNTLIRINKALKEITKLADIEGIVAKEMFCKTFISS